MVSDNDDLHEGESVLRRLERLELLMDALGRIRKFNQEEREDPLPDTEGALVRILRDITVVREEREKILDELKQAGYIFVMELTHAQGENPESEVRGVLVAELTIVTRLLQFYRQSLEKLYEYEFFRRADTSSIIKDLTSKIERYKNTPMGRVLNIVIMLQQFEYLLTEHYDDYTPARKKSNLRELLGGKNWEEEELDRAGAGAAETEAGSTQEAASPRGSSGGFGEQGTAPAWRRAVETPEYKKIQEMDLSGNWGKAVAHYGVNFLLRIHFRKYEFQLVRKLVEQGRIARKEDLEYIRDTLVKIQGNISRDRKLKIFLSEIAQLSAVVISQIKRIERLEEQSES